MKVRPVKKFDVRSGIAKILLTLSFCSSPVVHGETLIESWIPPSELKLDRETNLTPQQFCKDLKSKAVVQCAVVGFPDG